MSNFMKNFALTREELDRQLEALEGTRDDFQVSQERNLAMCYVPGEPTTPDYVPVPSTCDGCGRRFTIRHIPQWHEDDIIDAYDDVARKFRALGYDARIRRYCPRCIREKGLPTLTDRKVRELIGRTVFLPHRTSLYFAFRVSEAGEYHLSPLYQHRLVCDHLMVAYQFLKSPESYTKLYAAYQIASLEWRDNDDEDVYGSPEDIRGCVEFVLGIGDEDEARKGDGR